MYSWRTHIFLLPSLRPVKDTGSPLYGLVTLVAEQGFWEWGEREGGSSVSFRQEESHLSLCRLAPVCLQICIFNKYIHISLAQWSNRSISRGTKSIASRIKVIFWLHIDSPGSSVESLGNLYFQNVIQLWYYSLNKYYFSCFNIPLSFCGLFHEDRGK